MTGSMMLLMGASGGLVVPFPSGSTVASVTGPATATCQLSVQATGNVVITEGTFGPWVRPVGPTNPGYWCKWVLNSGTAPTGPAQNTYVQMSGNLDLSLVRSVLGTSTANLTISVSTTNSDAGLVTSGAWTMTAQVN